MVTSPVPSATNTAPAVDLTKHWDGQPHALFMKVARAVKEPFKWLALAFGVAGFGALAVAEMCVVAAPLLLIVTLSCFGAALLSYAAHKVLTSCSARWQQGAAAAVDECLRELSGLSTPPDASDRAMVLLRRYGGEVRQLKMDGGRCVDGDGQPWAVSRRQAYLNLVAAYCPQLCTLELSQMDLNGLALDALKGLPLTALTVEGGSCDDSQLDELIGGRALEGLHLVDCMHLSGAPLQKMDKGELTELTLKGCRLRALEHVTDPAATVRQWIDDKLDDEQHGTALAKAESRRRLQQDSYWTGDRVIDEAEAAAGDGSLPTLGKDDLAFLSDCPRLKKLTVSHLDDEALHDAIAPLPKLEELTIPYSGVLTGSGFSAFSERDRWHTFKSKFSTLVIGCCPALEATTISHWNSYWRLSTIHFALALSSCGDAIDDLAAARALLRQHFRPTDRYTSPKDDIIDTWQRR